MLPYCGPSVYKPPQMTCVGPRKKKFFKCLNLY
jgi:hypothetical protein